MLYLLIVSGYAGKEWAQAKDNRNRVYERIFRDIHRRDLSRPRNHPSKIGIESEEDFFTLMECLGLAAWLGGGRSGSDGDFSTIRERVYFTKRGGRFKGKTSAGLKNVAVQTFTHRGDGDEPGYAFIHKSFGEYLTARAMVEAGEKWLERHEGEAGEFADDWLQLAGGGRLTSDILDFMVDEARLRSSETQEARARVAKLSSVASHTLQHGFPAHGELITYKGSADWRRREIFQRNAEEGLYALIHAWAEAGYPFEVTENGKVARDWEPGPIKIDEWTTKRAAADMLARLRDQWSSGGLANRIFQHWDLSGADLSGADLSGADLSGADLFGANLFGANCSRLDIDSARLEFANLSEAVNLRQEQIDKAKGNSETKLPDGMQMPTHWSDDD